MKHPLPFLCVLGGLLAGCNVVSPPQADAVRFYVLTGPAPAAGGPAQTQAAGLRVGLKTVEVADYLKTRAIAVRRGTNELILDDYARWAEPLNSAISRIVREQLLAAQGVGRVYVQPFPFDADRDCDISITVTRCEGAVSADGRATTRFSAAIEVSSAGANPRLLARKEFVAPESAWNDRDYARLAAVLSDDVAALGREAAAALQPASPAP